jgi:hypothetical protein
MGRHLRRVFWCVPVLAAALYLGAQTNLAPINLSGVWVLRVPRNDGTFNESFFEQKQDGDAISGAMLGSRETPIADGASGNGKLHRVVRVGAAGKQQRETAYDGTLERRARRQRQYHRQPQVPGHEGSGGLCSL